MGRVAMEEFSPVVSTLALPCQYSFHQWLIPYIISS